ncbi:MAG TPA: TIGR04283 family arsenosugar biosynthesis glycosyltransferase [Candidatus Deferrimicrobiaceae bacterium]
MISVIIPTLDEEEALPGTIRSCREAGECEVIVADGGSGDGTMEIARRLADRVVAAPRGRALQMNAGAGTARGDILLFLHADTVLPPCGLDAVVHALRDRRVAGGAFRVALLPSPGAGLYVRAMLSLTGGMINLRSALTRSCTGDQAIFLRAETFRELGGYREIPLMEDVELSRAVRAKGRTVLLPNRVWTSGRRWEAWGPLRTILRMWRIRIAYLLGATPERCAEIYRREPFPLTSRTRRAPRSAGGV